MRSEFSFQDVDVPKCKFTWIYSSLKYLLCFRLFLIIFRDNFVAL